MSHPGLAETNIRRQKLWELPGADERPVMQDFKDHWYRYRPIPEPTRPGSGVVSRQFQADSRIAAWRAVPPPGRFCG